MVQNTRKKVDQILIASHRVKNLHMQMIRLEVNGKQNSSSFHKIINYLDLAVESLEETVARQNLTDVDFTKTYHILNELRQDKDNLLFPQEVINQDAYLDATAYLLKHIELKMRENYLKYSNILPINIQSVSEINNPLDLQTLQDILGAEVEIVRGILITLIKQIENFITQSEDTILNNTLIKTKYQIAFSHPDIHYELRNNNYQTQDNILIDHFGLYLNISENTKNINYLYQYKLHYLAWLIEYLIASLYNSLKKGNLHEVTMNKFLIKSAIINLSFYPAFVEVGKDALLKDIKRNYNNEFVDLIEIVINEAMDEYRGNYVRFKEPSYSIVRKGEQDD